MAEVLAGFVCGYALAVLATPVFAISLVRARVNSEHLRRIVPPATPLAAVSIIFHGFAFLVFTAIGMLLGVMLQGVEDNRPDGGLGSPNGTFTFMILAISAIAVLPMAAVLRRWRGPLFLTGAVFAATFGWIMPWLSLLGPEGS
jgi:hypothetical protein